MNLSVYQGSRPETSWSKRKVSQPNRSALSITDRITPGRAWRDRFSAGPAGRLIVTAKVAIPMAYVIMTPGGMVRRLANCWKGGFSPRHLWTRLASSDVVQ